jgi:hypothetical protein
LEQFIDEFLFFFEIYDYDRLCSEVNDLRMKSDESIEEFSTRFIHLCCRFPLNDLSYISEWFQHLVSLSLEHDQSESALILIHRLI